jgi:arginine N-succinyltransferase
VDSEHLSGLLAQAGHTLTEEIAQAQCVVVNTCAFIREAEEESIATILDVADLKKSGKLRTLYVAGCLPQKRRGEKEDLVALLPEVDGFLGPGDLQKLPQLLERGQSPRGSPSDEQGGHSWRRRRESEPAGPVPRIVGCSLIIAKHGTKGKPHLWFAIGEVTKRSRTLGLRRSHQVLLLGSTEDGPTQVGGLAVLPGFRDHPAHCGLQLSYVRFLYMAMHPQRFEKRILVEYRGISQDGQRSPFWEAVGSVFTGLTYKRADRLSVTNKEFIVGLMPREPIYAQLLPRSVQRAIGAVHPAARKAVRLLTRIGFHPIPQVEPFDAGRYYAADCKEVRIIRQTRRVRVLGEGRAGDLCLVGTDRGGFRAALARAALGKGRCGLEPQALKLLQLKPGDAIYACPI